MGGNALKIAKTRRYSKEEYEAISIEIKNKLKQYDIVSEIPLSYNNKESFGDLDILILNNSDISNDIDLIIKDEFKPNETYNNGSVHSFDYKEFQIDFILVKPSEWNTSIVYFSYNDLGNLIGRIAVKLGFRYGNYGLKYTHIHDNGGKKNSMIVSTINEDIYKFLGFDWDRYQKGFDSVEDIFEFVVNSKYFIPSIFAYENLDHQNRTRNRKRKNYAKFLDYIKDIDNHLLYVNIKNDKNKYHFNRAETFFDIDITSRIEKWENEVQLAKIASNKFNGKIINTLYGLENKELGYSIAVFKKYVKENYVYDHSNDNREFDYIQWILDTRISEILSIFEEVNNIYN